MDPALVVAVGGFVVAAAAIWMRARADERLRRAQAALARSEDDLRRRERSSEEARGVRDRILSSMRDGVLLLDPMGATAYANPAVESLLGARPAGVGGLFPLTIREIAERAGADGEAGAALVETGVPPRWLQVQALPADEDASVLLVIRDVTEARQIDAIRRDFVANASHELKTPAASIRAAAETLRQAAADDPVAVPRFAQQLEREAVRLSRIVADLLDLSRLESGSERGERVHLDAVVREEAQRFEEPARAAGLALAVDAPAPVPLRGSARDLSLLVRNLVDNAIRYTRPGGSVTVAVGLGGDGGATLRVQDTGVGIPRRDLGRIFERFYRVDRARSRETGGTGLGLAIVKHVAENHGGSVHIESELGAGTTVSVVLPPEGGDGTARP